MDEVPEKTKQDIEFISSLGYDVSDLEKTDDGYLVEGDIWLPDEWLEQAREQPKTRLSRHSMVQPVSQQYQDKLYLNVVGSPAFWDKPITKAIDNWNDLRNCNIQVGKMASSDGQEITITFRDKFYFLDYNKLIKVSFSWLNGGPGSIDINGDNSYLPKGVDLQNDNTAAQNNATYLIMHAIGHAIGLGHTPKTQSDAGIGDEDWGSSIPGTNYYDGSSIMNRETLPFSWTGFSAKDNIDIPKVFPIPEPEKPALKPGSIESTKNLSHGVAVFSISSVTPASEGAGPITYAWEKKRESGSSWDILSGQTGVSLTNTPAPTELRSEYRRIATDGTKTERSNICVVTTSSLSAGSITQTLTIDTENPDDQLTITSTESAVCPSGVTYSWEIMVGNSWAVIPSATGASLTVAAPQSAVTTYKRKAICAHESGYSNICKIYNKFYINAGTITELVELYKTGFTLYFDILSESAASLTESVYYWEINSGNNWVTYTNYIGSGESLTHLNSSYGRITKFRRVISTPFGSVYSNECTVINYAVREDPQEGTFRSKAIKIGPYGSNFTETIAIDTRGEYFRDDDRLNGGGNDAFFELEITERMYVDIITGAVPMSVWLDVWNKVPDGKDYYNNISSGPLAEIWNPAEYILFPVIEDEPQYPEEWIKTFYLFPGKYAIMLQGSKVYNSGAVNDVISISLRGTALPY